MGNLERQGLEAIPGEFRKAKEQLHYNSENLFYVHSAQEGGLLIQPSTVLRLMHDPVNYLIRENGE